MVSPLVLFRVHRETQVSTGLTENLGEEDHLAKT